MVRIIKNKKKIFHIRRKNLDWFENTKPIDSFKPLSIRTFTWNSIKKSEKDKQLLMMNIYKVHSEVSFFLKKTLKKTEENSYFLDFYASYCHSLTKYTSKFYSLNEHNLNSIIISTPKTQLFFTLSKNKPVLIYTPGVIRLVMQLLEKCAKKRKPVILNSIKFLWNSSRSTFTTPVKLKLIKNINILPKIFLNAYKNNFKLIEYILLEPKINFGFQNLPKRASIKKKLRKKKKYINE